MHLIPFIQPIWLDIHNMADNRKYKTMGEIFYYENLSESKYDSNRAVAMNVKESKWTSVHVENKLSYHLI